MQLNQLIELSIKGGFTVIVLLLCSILSIGVIIQKSIYLRGLSEKVTSEFAKKLFPLVKDMRLSEAVELCNSLHWKFAGFKINTPLTNVVKLILEKRETEKNDLLDLSYNKLDKEITSLEKGLGVLSTLGAISPFIGLFGTVVGIIKSFEALSLSNTQNYSQVMAGIAEALIATAAGLFVAIPAVLFYNYFMKKIKLSIPGFDEVILELVHLLKKS
jgi:biopolymer transport protein ExbB/TolQ